MEGYEGASPQPLSKGEGPVFAVFKGIADGFASIIVGEKGMGKVSQIVAVPFHKAVGFVLIGCRYLPAQATSQGRVDTCSPQA